MNHDIIPVTLKITETPEGGRCVDFSGDTKNLEALLEGIFYSGRKHEKALDPNALAESQNRKAMIIGVIGFALGALILTFLAIQAMPPKAPQHGNQEVTLWA